MINDNVEISVEKFIFEEEMGVLHFIFHVDDPPRKLKIWTENRQIKTEVDTPDNSGLPPLSQQEVVMTGVIVIDKYLVKQGWDYQKRLRFWSALRRPSRDP